MGRLSMLIFKMRAITLAMAVALGWFASPGSAIAQECTTEAPTSHEVGEWRGTVSAADRDAVMDVIHSLAWTLDLQLSENFEDLFTEDVVYEACTGGGILINAEPDNQENQERQSRDALITYFETQPFAFLTERGARARHFLANTVLRDTSNAGEIEARTAMLVTLQRSDVEVPSVDYTATLVMILTTREDGVYKIAELYMHTDEPETIFRAR
jgi:hypothetical protein